MACLRKRAEKWQCQVRRKGFRPRSKSFARRKDAERWGLIQERDLDLLESRGEVEPSRPTLTLRDALERARQRMRAGSGESYLAKAMERRPIAVTLLAELKRRDIIEYRDFRASEVGPTTVARELWLLKRTFELARSEWGCSALSNPVEGVAKPRLPRGRERRLVGDEEQRLLAAAHEVMPLAADLIRFALATAMRQGEMLSLLWVNCNLGNRTALLPITKNGRARTVPLSTAAMAVLRSRAGGKCERVFPLTADGVKLSWARLTKRAGIEGLHFHDLRHEAISRLFEHGLEMPSVMMISGHTDPRALVRYTHLHARRLVERLDQI